MPRPGPRPYECVRRAWHSDRHQPIRGSLIQEIFRVVCEIHSSATRKNKEWQEKLPLVVLKAEEIMYSKANSEAEYMDLKTLWDRTNDAINTIIRRDESTETGDLLQPCIEAALNLGCTPRRASRSQRNISPSCYLNPGTQEPNSFSPGIVHGTIQANHAANIQYIPHFSNFMKPTILNSIHLGPESQNFVCQNNILTHNKLCFPTENVPLSNNNQRLRMENYPVSNLCSVYPLYYGNYSEPKHGVDNLPISATSNKEPINVGLMQNPFSHDNETPVKISQTDLKGSTLNPHEIVCDLSLRLGSPSVPLPNVKGAKLEVVTDVGYNCPRSGSRFNDCMSQIDTEPSFLARANLDNPLDSCSGKLNEDVNVNVKMKKRKAVFGHLLDDQQFRWQPNLSCSHLTSRMKM